MTPMIKMPIKLLAAAAFLALLTSPAAAETSIAGDSVATSVSAEDAVVLEAEAAAARRADCETRGFDALALDCRLCEDLGAFLQQATTGEEAKALAAREVGADCRACCTDFALAAREDAAVHAQFARAALEVDKRRLERFPKVANFVNNRAALEHPQLEITYLAGRKPHLVFFDTDGVKQEEISIGNWDENAISEFIGAKLRPQEANQGDEGASRGEEVTDEDGDQVVEVEVAADLSS